MYKHFHKRTLKGFIVKNAVEYNNMLYDHNEEKFNKMCIKVFISGIYEFSVEKCGRM